MIGLKATLYDLYLKSGLVRAAYHLSAPRAWRRDVLAAATARPADPGAPESHLREAMAWLSRAQDAVAGGGVSAFYTVRGGWDAPYPETTGYILCTFFDYAEFTGNDAYRQRAVRMADWEVAIQNPDGSFPGQPLQSRSQPPVVFDVGQILQGLVRAHAETGDDKYLAAGKRAGDWLLAHQDPDGPWRRYQYQDTPHAYDARVAWPLASLFRATGDERYGEAAHRFCEWVASGQKPSGWYAHAAFRRGDPPLTHTIAYTLEGMFEAGVELKEPKFRQSAARGAYALLERYEETAGRWDRAPRGLVPGRLDEQWRSRDAYACLTGCAQLALVWLRMAEEEWDPRLVEGAKRLLDATCAVQNRRARDDGMRGALAGSHPLGGGYISWAYPNWAAKFLADALLHRLRLGK